MGVIGNMVGSILGLESSGELIGQRSTLIERENAIRANLQKLNTELAFYGTDGYMAFRNTVLCQEKARLATLLIEAFGEDPDGRDARLGIRGQYAEVRRIMERPEELKLEIQQAEQELYAALTDLQNLETKIKAAKDREA